MTTTSSESLTAAAQRYLWMHFTPMSSDPNAEVPVIVRGEGAWVFDQNGKRYLDGLAGLFVSQVGHGRDELADAAATQARKLAYFRRQSVDWNRTERNLSRARASKRELRFA